MSDEEIKLNLSGFGQGDLSQYATTNYTEVIAEYKSTMDELGISEDDLPVVSEQKPNLSYPLNMSDDDEYPVRIIFRSRALDFTETDQWKNQVSPAIDKIRDQVVSFPDTLGKKFEEDPVGTGLGIAAGTIAGGSFGNIKSTLGGFVGAGIGLAVSTAVASGEGEEFFTNLSNLSKATVDLTSIDNYEGGELVGTVTLPLQRALQYNDRANYNQGAATNFGQGFLSAGSSLMGKDGELQDTTQGLLSRVLARATGAGVGAAIGGAASKLPFGGMGLGTIAGAVGAEPLANFAKEASRVAINPNLRTLFEGVPIRTFSFPFRMVARSEKEAIEIKKIVKFLRSEVYPEAVNAGVENNIPFAYKFPNIFEIEIKDKFGNNPGFKIQRSYLNSVTTMFNQTATGMYEGKENNYFIEVDMTLEFIEVATMDKGKVTGVDENGGY